MKKKIIKNWKEKWKHVKWKNEKELLNESLITLCIIDSWMKVILTYMNYYLNVSRSNLLEKFSDQVWAFFFNMN